MDVDLGIVAFWHPVMSVGSTTDESSDRVVASKVVAVSQLGHLRILEPLIVSNIGNRHGCSKAGGVLPSL